MRAHAYKRRGRVQHRRGRSSGIYTRWGSRSPSSRTHSCVHTDSLARTCCGPVGGGETAESVESEREKYARETQPQTRTACVCARRGERERTEWRCMSGGGPVVCCSVVSRERERAVCTLRVRANEQASRGLVFGYDDPDLWESTVCWISAVPALVASFEVYIYKARRRRETLATRGTSKREIA